MCVLTHEVHAQNFPNKPLRIVTTVPGGGLDIAARILAPKLSERLGQQVIVDNRGGVLSMELVARAPADGYTLLLASGSLWLTSFMRANVPWDTLRDYAPVSLLVTSPNIIVTHPSLPVQSVRDLIALAKARPGELNYSTGQSGASAHLAGELFKHMAKVNLSRVAFKGMSAAMLSLMSGESHLSFPNAAAAASYVRAGRLNGLAVTSALPSALAPGLPTVAASGLPGYESKAILGLFAPVKTAPALVEVINAEVVRVLGNADVKQRLFDSGSGSAPSTPLELMTAIKTDMMFNGKMIRETGIRAE